MAVETHPFTLASNTRGYRAIGDYDMIGDCRSAALIATDASIDWCCLPNFDSQPLFSRLIGAPRGGFLAITSVDDDTLPQPISHRYVPDTAIRESVIRVDGALLRVTDFMPMGYLMNSTRWPETEPCIVRRVEAIETSCRFAMRFKVTTDYGRSDPHMTIGSDGLIVTGSSHGVAVLSFADHRPDHIALEDEERGSGVCVSLHTLSLGETITFVLGWAAHPFQANQLRRAYRRDWAGALEETMSFWHTWVAHMSYEGVYRETVVRSAITLKLLTFSPTGAMVAAPTTSLPESIGGTRNWDYRYTWIRDSSFTAGALASLGYIDEAIHFVQWVEHRERRSDRELRIMYGIFGDRQLPEIEIAPLEGYRQSGPVRIGNGAADQQQLDIYGEWLDCVARIYLQSGAPAPESWLMSLIDSTVTFVCDHWMEPDAGIWEVRSGRKHFVYSKVLCWAAVDRGILLAERYDWAVDIDRWRRVRELIHEDVLANGIDETTGAFKIAYDLEGLDAASLMIPIVGFLPPRDPRVIATTNAIAAHLTDQRGLVYRYLHFDDGVGGEEGTFIMCSYWLAENLALQGRRTEATKLFERILDHASPTGLLSEMIDSESGALLGNYPQAFSHLGLIRTALVLAQLDEGRDVLAWTRSQPGV